MPHFFVHGTPVSKGSARAFVVNWSPGQRHRPHANVVQDTAKELAEWEKKIRFATYDAGARPIEGPVFVALVFNLPRPKRHFGTGKNAEVLRDDAPPTPHRSRPDLDKLVRAVLDALRIQDKQPGGVYQDDIQVVRVEAEKRYGQAPGVSVTVEPLGAAAERAA